MRNGNASHQVHDTYVKFIYKKENEKHIVQHYLIWVQDNIPISFDTALTGKNWVENGGVGVVGAP